MSNLRGSIDEAKILGQTNSLLLKQVLRNKSDKTGWDDLPPVILSFDNGNLRFSITPTGDSFEYWIQGQKFIKYAAETVDISDTEGVWYIYYVLNVLTASQTPWLITDDNKALVAIIHWDLTNQIEIGILYELHNYLMHASTHDWAHETIGTRYHEGLSISLGGGGDIGKVGYTTGSIHDENIDIDITDGAGGSLFEQVLTLPAQIPVFYRSGSAAWRKYAAGDFPFYDNSGGDNIHYNLDTAGSWASQEASGANKYIAMWIYGTNEINEPIVAIMGQNESNTVALARVNNTLDTLSFGTLPFSEMKILHRLILRTDGGTIESLDLRATSNLPGGTFVPTSHGSLSGLGNDDHTIYILADGTRAFGGVQSHGNNDIDDVASILFDINDGAASEEGRLKWNSVDGTLEVGMPGGNVNLQIGQEELIRVRNVTGSTILNGRAVRIAGVSGNTPTIDLSDANNPAKAGMIGLATEDIAHNDYGFVTTSGMVRDIDTLAWSVADRLFVSQTPGVLTNVYPSGTDRIILAGIVIKDSETEGMIWVLPINQAHLAELSGVTISSPADNELLAYDSGTGTWINQTAAEAGLATDPGDKTKRIPVFNIKPDSFTTAGNNNAYWVSGFGNTIRHGITSVGMSWLRGDFRIPLDYKSGTDIYLKFFMLANGGAVAQVDSNIYLLSRKTTEGVAFDVSAATTLLSPTVIAAGATFYLATITLSNTSLNFEKDDFVAVVVSLDDNAAARTIDTQGYHIEYTSENLD